jgi:hypothetical protein
VGREQLCKSGAAAIERAFHRSFGNTQKPSDVGVRVSPNVSKRDDQSVLLRKALQGFEQRCMTLIADGARLGVFHQAQGRFEFSSTALCTKAVDGRVHQHTVKPGRARGFSVETNLFRVQPKEDVLNDIFGFVGIFHDSPNHREGSLAVLLIHGV